MLTESQITMLKKQKEFSIFNTPILNSFFGFWLYIIKKIIFACTSVKVWALVGFSWINAWLLVQGYLESSGFAAIQISLITTTLVAREFSKSANNSIVEKIQNMPIVEKLTEAAGFGTQDKTLGTELED
jgi:hypothetical protein